MNAIRKALELALSHKDDCKQDPETCDCFSARTYRSAKEALALLPPEGEPRGFRDLAEALVAIDWCIGYELTKAQHLELDRIRSLAFDLLAEPAPSSEKALREALTKLPRYTPRPTYTSNAVPDMRPDPQYGQWVKWSDVLVVGLATLHHVASSPAPEIPKC